MADELSDEELLKLSPKDVPRHLRSRYIRALGGSGAKQPRAAVYPSEKQVMKIASKVERQKRLWFRRLTAAEQAWHLDPNRDPFEEVSNPSLLPLKREFDEICENSDFYDPEKSYLFVWFELRRRAIAKIRS